MNRPFTTLVLLVIAATAFGQGDLLPPPGPPGPTMKTLDQIEARTIVNATNTPGDVGNTYIISLPGSYYLTRNLAGDPSKHGISIQASDVTLDLNGFVIFNLGAGTGTIRGVNVPAEQKNLRIRNGTVRGWTDGGVRAENARSVFAEKLLLSDNTGAAGLFVGLGSLVKECVANANRNGIQTLDRCQVMNCISTENTHHGFESTSYVSIVDCTSSRNLLGGIIVDSGCSIIRCSATRNAFTGISGLSGSCAVSDCTVTSNLYGITINSGIVVNCTVSSNSNIGISATGSRVANCSASFNGADGIDASRGDISNCSADYNFANGIDAVSGSVVSSSARNNGGTGISADSIATCTASENGTFGFNAEAGTITNSMANYNAGTGILANQASVTNCNARSNGNHGIDGAFSVVAFSIALHNNRNNNGSEDLHITGNSHRTGNVPSP